MADEEPRPIVKAQLQAKKLDDTFEDLNSDDAGRLQVSDPQAEANQYYDRVFYDEDTGIAGTDSPVGTPQVPSDVIADVITMCVARNLHKIEVHGALTLGAAMQHYCFFGHEHEDIADILDLNGEDVDGSHIEGLIVTGGQGGAGFLTLIKCIVTALANFRGRMEDCSLFTGASSFRDGGTIDLDDCKGIFGTATLTVQAPALASIRRYAGDLILTAQDGGVCRLEGFKGTLEIDDMAAGTLSIYANGADITINGDCDGGTINIYGNARVIDNSAAGCTVNNYTLNATQLHVMDFWSVPQEEVALTNAAGDKALSTITVADLPDGATIVRAIVMFKFRMVENTNAAENELAGAQEIQIQDDGGGAWTDAINFVANMFRLAATTREGGDVIIGAIDVSGAGFVDGNDTYNVQWDEAVASLDGINFNDVQVGLRIWYSV